MIRDIFHIFLTLQLYFLHLKFYRYSSMCHRLLKMILNKIKLHKESQVYSVLFSPSLTPPHFVSQIFPISPLKSTYEWSSSYPSHPPSLPLLRISADSGVWNSSILMTPLGSLLKCRFWFCSWMRLETSHFKQLLWCNWQLVPSSVNHPLSSSRLFLQSSPTNLHTAVDSLHQISMINFACCLITI